MTKKNKSAHGGLYPAAAGKVDEAELQPTKYCSHARRDRLSDKRHGMVISFFLTFERARARARRVWEGHVSHRLCSLVHPSRLDADDAGETGLLASVNNAPASKFMYRLPTFMA
jgi:hypothetical protein